MSNIFKGKFLRLRVCLNIIYWVRSKIYIFKLYAYVIKNIQQRHRSHTHDMDMDMDGWLVYCWSYTTNVNQQIYYCIWEGWDDFCKIILKCLLKLKEN